MSRGSILRGVVTLAVLLTLGPGVASAQQKPLYGVEEYNAYVDTTRSEDPKEKLAAIEAFLKSYPNSVLRAFVYPNQAETAFRIQQHAVVLKAVDGFLGMDRNQVADLYRQSQYNEQQIDTVYYQQHLLYTYSFVQSFREGPNADAAADKAAARAREGLKLHEALYSQVQPPTDAAQRQQFEQQKQQAEAAFHSVLAFTAYRKNDFAGAAREYDYLLWMDPNNAQYTYRLSVAYLKQQPPQILPALWWLARTVVLTPGEKEKSQLRDTLTQNMASYEGLFDPACAQGEVDSLIQRAQNSPTMPGDWRVPAREDVQMVRDGLNVAVLMEGLKAGGEQARLTWLASCHLPFPEIPGVVLSVEDTGTQNSLLFKLAITEEAADASRPEIELRIKEQPEAKLVRKGDEVHFTGVLYAYESEPFLLRLGEGRIKPEDIPKTRGRGGAGRGAAGR